ncbi:plasmid mobilization relaxosome protein MobC [Olivibacter sp. XZL3]|uniref:plasmid mobilization protein n=1 Tax=Olivibacter sp. XZL3 TaxID=1735116 RepID=UPI001066A5EF|nr:plasmid mobilization relaxosome protein MobC [Olivibacter sp. XZL3]
MEKENDKRSRIIGLRLTTTEYDKIKSKCARSTTPQLSEYIRRIILGKPVTMFTRDRSLDEFMIEIMRLRKELNSVGVNFNQAVKKLNAMDKSSEITTWATVHEIDRRTVLKQVQIIGEWIDKMGDKWLR